MAISYNALIIGTRDQGLTLDPAEYIPLSINSLGPATTQLGDVDPQTAASWYLDPNLPSFKIWSGLVDGNITDSTASKMAFSNWDTVKALEIHGDFFDVPADQDATRKLSIYNFVHTNLDFSSSRVSVVLDIDGVKRGDIKTSSFTDTVEIGLLSNRDDWSNKFTIDLGTGSDRLTVVRAQEDYTIPASIGVENNTGVWTTMEVNAGSGRDTIDTSQVLSKDIITAGGGIDKSFNLGSNVDTVIFNQPQANYIVSSETVDSDLVTTVRFGNFTAATVYNAEFIQFSDTPTPVALDAPNPLLIKAAVVGTATQGMSVDLSQFEDILDPHAAMLGLDSVPDSKQLTNGPEISYAINGTTLNMGIGPLVNGQVVVDGNTWNTAKTAYISGDFYRLHDLDILNLGGNYDSVDALNVYGFVDVRMDLSTTGKDGSTVKLDGLKRGDIALTNQSDTLEVGLSTNDGQWVNTIKINTGDLGTGGGDDTVIIKPAEFDYKINGVSNVTNGEFTKINITLGQGNDSVDSTQVSSMDNVLINDYQFGAANVREIKTIDSGDGADTLQLPGGKYFISPVRANIDAGITHADITIDNDGVAGKTANDDFITTKNIEVINGSNQNEVFTIEGLTSLPNIDGLPEIHAMGGNDTFILTLEDLPRHVTQVRDVFVDGGAGRDNLAVFVKADADLSTTGEGPRDTSSSLTIRPGDAKVDVNGLQMFGGEGPDKDVLLLTLEAQADLPSVPPPPPFPPVGTAYINLEAVQLVVEGTFSEIKLSILDSDIGPLVGTFALDDETTDKYEGVLLDGSDDLTSILNLSGTELATTVDLVNGRLTLTDFTNYAEIKDFSRIIGGQKGDTFIGNAENNSYIGDAGNDVYMATNDGSTDLISDFAIGSDKIDIATLLDADFTQVVISQSLNNVSNTTVEIFNIDNSLAMTYELESIDHTQITVDDFLV